MGLVVPSKLIHWHGVFIEGRGMKLEGRVRAEEWVGSKKKGKKKLLLFPWRGVRWPSEALIQRHYGRH